MVVIIMAVCLTLVFGAGGTALYRYYNTPKSLESGKRKRTEYDCEMFTTRLFEQRLIDAGIKTTLTRCSDAECFVCHPKSKELPRPKPPKGSGGVGNAIVYPAATAECHQCNVQVSRGMDTCQPCTQDLLESRRLEREKNKRPLRYRQIGNRRVPMPTEVPDNAYGGIDYDPVRLSDRVVWKWTDPKSGQQKYLTMYLPDSIDIYCDQYEEPVQKIYDNSYAQYKQAKIVNFAEVEVDSLLDGLKISTIRGRK